LAPAFFINIPKSEEELTNDELNQTEDELTQTEFPLLTCPNGHAIQNGHAIPNGRLATGLLRSPSISILKPNSFSGKLFCLCKL
jgi:hypothetical protein